jgi:hypothetical protein
MLADKERLAHEEHERLRLARRVARLWSWEYRVDTNTVLWTIPEAHSDRTVQVTLERRKRSSPAPGVPVRQTADAGLGTVHRGANLIVERLRKGKRDTDS